MKVNINLDTTPILYTDNIFTKVNEDGVVFEFCQPLGSPTEVRIVARIGMSHSHAKKFLKSLESSLKNPTGQPQTGKTVRA